MASRSKRSKDTLNGMRTLYYYFEGPPRVTHSDAPPIVLNIGCKRKRPVGRPKKVPKTDSSLTSPVIRLVAYSSTESEVDETLTVEGATSASTNEAHSSKEPKKIRKMYSKGQKKKVADYARFHGVRKAAKKFSVGHSNVVRWQKEEVSRIRNPVKRSHKCGQGRKLTYSKELEDKLVAWILEKRETDCVAISTQVIRCKALALITPVKPSFKASDGWVRKFMKRNNLVLRAKTHISQALPKDLEEKISAFRRQVTSIFENGDFPLEFVCNMDETPVFLDLVPNRVVDKRGKKTINVRTTASEKNRVTTTLCCTASGKMLPPFVVFKGKTKRSIKKVSVPYGVVCTTQAKGWMDEERMIEWIQKVWGPYVKGNRALLSLDTFSGHLTNRVKDSFHKCGTTLLVIPGGCTSVLQPLDVSINKPFKGYIRQKWCERMVQEAESGVSKITPASKAILMEWIKTAADLVEKSPTTIKKSFQVTGIISKPDSTRSDAVCEEIENVMEKVFGQAHMGYVEPTEDPFASDDSDDSDPFIDSLSDTDISGPSYSDIESDTDIESH